MKHSLYRPTPIRAAFTTSELARQHEYRKALLAYRLSLVMLGLVLMMALLMVVAMSR